MVLDTVPSGESRKFIFFPKVFGNISKKLLKLAGSLSWAASAISPLVGMPAPSREVVETETKLIIRMEKLGDILSDSGVTSLRLVSNPDPFSINDMRRAFITSNLYGINVDLAIINKVLPEEITDPFFSKWMTTQTEVMEYADTSFCPLPILTLRLFESELKGLSMLKEGCHELFGDEDPTKIYFVGTPIETIHQEGQLLLKVKAPFVEKDACEVERIGDEAIVKICSDIGESVNVIPLPALTHQMSLTRAKILDNELIIYFTEQDSRKEVNHMANLLNNLSEAQKNMEKIFVEVLPDSYLKPVSHLNNAQVEVLKAINSLIENRIEGLEYIGEEIEKKSKKKVVRKEKEVE